MFATVFQEVQVLAFTLGQNVAGAEHYDRTRAEQALRQVGLWDKVHSLPQDMDSMMLKVIEEEGTMLSGGEQQKLAIARALYKGGHCVIMDEPTSALDPLAEAEIYEQMDRMAGSRTAIFMSHRMSSSVFCDRIIVLDEGRIQAMGSHHALMQDREGLYYRLFQSQAEHYRLGDS